MLVMFTKITARLNFELELNKRAYDLHELHMKSLAMMKTVDSVHDIMRKKNLNMYTIYLQLFKKSLKCFTNFINFNTIRRYRKRVKMYLILFYSLYIIRRI